MMEIVSNFEEFWPKFNWLQNRILNFEEEINFDRTEFYLGFDELISQPNLDGIRDKNINLKWHFNL